MALGLTGRLLRFCRVLKEQTLSEPHRNASSLLCPFDKELFNFTLTLDSSVWLQ